MIRRIAKSALIGAVWADLHFLLLVLFYKIVSFKDVFSSISRPLIVRLLDLVLNYTLVLPWKSVYSFIANSSGLPLPSLWDILVTCSIIGGLLGIILLSWAKKPVKRALKLSALTIGMSALFIGIILIERIPGIKTKERQPLPPRNYAGPNISLPEGFRVEEVEIGDIAAAVPSTAEKDNAEERISFLDQDVDGVIYRLTTYMFERWPWPYVLMRKKRSDSKWSVLGPFLPGLGVEGFPAFNLSDNQVFIQGDCLK